MTKTKHIFCMNFIYNLLRIRNIPKKQQVKKLKEAEVEDSINQKQYRQQIIKIEEEIKQRVVSNEYERIE